MTARSDCEELMGALVPFAEKMLGEYGEFYPYGGALTSGGAVEMAAGFDGTDRPPSADLIRLIKEGLTIGAAAGRYRATGVVHDARLLKPSAEQMNDAIAVSLDHRDDFSVVVYFPYARRWGVLKTGAPLAQRGEADIFVRRR